MLHKGILIKKLNVIKYCRIIYFDVSQIIKKMLKYNSKRNSINLNEISAILLKFEYCNKRLVSRFLSKKN